MNNFEKYNKLHNEVIKRLEDGEITIEQAKEVNDLAFDKYIVEAVSPLVIPITIIGGIIAKTVYDIKKSKDEIKQKNEEEEKQDKKEIDDMVADINSEKPIFTLDDKDLKINTVSDVFKYVETDVKNIINYIKKDNKYKQKIKDEINKSLSNIEDDDIEDYKKSVNTYKILCKVEKSSEKNMMITVVDGEQDARIALGFIVYDIERVIRAKYSKVFSHFNIKMDSGDGDEGSLYFEVSKK